MILKEYFKNWELECRCGCGLLPDKRSIEKLYALRLIINEKIIITSGARCENYNAAVGGVNNSTHLIGAFDVEVDKPYRYDLIKAAQSVGFTGIGLDGKFIHIDDKHDTPVVWFY